MIAVSRGLMEGFPDATFRGNLTLTRYQAAVIFARLLNLQDRQRALSSSELTTVRLALS